MTSNHLKHLVRHWIVVPDAANGPVFYPYPIVDNRARILMVLGRLDDARRIFDGSLRMAIAGGDQIKIADTKALIARLHWRRGEYPPADKLFQEALALYQQQGWDTGVNAIYNYLGGVYYELNEYDKALVYFEKRLAFFEEKNDARNVADTINNLGLVYWGKKDFDRALGYFHRQIEIGRELADVNVLAPGYANLGCVFDDMGKIDVALANYTKALDMSRKMGNIEFSAIIIGNMAIVYSKKKMLGQAEELYRQQGDIAAKIGAKQLTCRAISGMGDVFKIREDHLKAIGYYRRALAMAETLGYRLDAAMAHENIGYLLGKVGKPAEGLESMDKGVTVMRELKIGYYLCEFLCHKAELLLMLGKKNLSDLVVREARELAKQSARDDIVELCDTISRP